MKIAFLILAHKNPNQVIQLIKKLEHKNTQFYIHIDNKSNFNEFEMTFKEQGFTPEFMCNDVNIIYSSIRYIDATLILLKKAFEQGADYFVLLSGQDMPIRSIDEIVEFYTKNKDVNCVDYHPVPYSELAYNGLMRTQFYSLRYKDRMETIFPWSSLEHKMSLKGKLLNLMLMMKNRGKTKRNFPLGMTPFYSSQWFNLNREAIKYVFDFLNKNPVYYNYHKNALHPEEMFFQSIILNSVYKDSVVNDNLRYIEWKKGNKHPETLDIKNLNQLSETSEALFARKFNL